MPNEVDTLFSEIYPYKKDCKFQDCLHINEADCAVKANLDKIDETRYSSYIEFVCEAKEYKEKVKHQGIKQESSHKINNDKTSPKISSRKRQSARNTMRQKVYKDLDEEEI